jgi:lipopolysaccharide/colanic/teichoic acid biosynthesis glycosyltransferase
MTAVPTGPAPTAVSVPIARTPASYRMAKRALDLTVASIGLVLTSPVMAGIAAVIRLESPGPVFFRQERVGLGGRPFMLFKFRSMHDEADEAAHREYVQRLLKRGPAAEGEATWVPIASDPRVTRIGGFLRRSHLDELPQLFNIVRGEMSVVGPRPPIPYEVDLYEPWHLRRLSVIPGLTGLWQANGWGRLSFDEGVALDVEYVERRSFGLDLQIIGQTLWQVVTGRQF